MREDLLMNPAFQIITHHSPDHGQIDINVATVGAPDDPLIVCVHGWPESWHSWHGQMEFFSTRGFRVAAMDVRGYGGSSRPNAIEAYRLTELCSDVAAVIHKLAPSAGAILFGHDWGAPIVYNAARLSPGLVRAVAGLSVPYTPPTPGDPMELWDALYADRFFYMKSFQQPGVAEAAFESDLAAALRKVYFGASGDAPHELWFTDRPADAGMLDFLVDPTPAPAWLSTDLVANNIDANGGGPTHGWFNRYRAQKFDGDDLAHIDDPRITQPACFIAGEHDIVRRFVPGMDLYAGSEAHYADSRGATIIDGVGHWVQHEAPDATNAALDAFIATGI